MRKSISVYIRCNVLGINVERCWELFRDLVTRDYLLHQVLFSAVSVIWKLVHCRYILNSPGKLSHESNLYITICFVFLQPLSKIIQILLHQNFQNYQKTADRSNNIQMIKTIGIIFSLFPE